MYDSTRPLKTTFYYYSTISIHVWSIRNKTRQDGGCRDNFNNQYYVMQCLGQKEMTDLPKVESVIL